MNTGGFCPGSRSIREPTPEYLTCPNCGVEVEVWTSEVMHPCPNCKTPVFREQRPSCIDWCPYAQECVGPEVYRRLKGDRPPGNVTGKEPPNPIGALIQDHEEALTKLRLLEVGARGITESNSPAALGTAGQMAEFLDTTVRQHMDLEEQALFPVLQRRMGRAEKSTALMAVEHREIELKAAELQRMLRALEGNGGAQLRAQATESAAQIVRLWEGHIQKENATLLLVARKMLTPAEILEVARKWQTVCARRGGDPPQQGS